MEYLGFQQLKLSVLTSGVEKLKSVLTCILLFLISLLNSHADLACLLHSYMKIHKYILCVSLYIHIGIHVFVLYSTFMYSHYSRAGEKDRKEFIAELVKGRQMKMKYCTLFQKGNISCTKYLPAFECLKNQAYALFYYLYYLSNYIYLYFFCPCANK